MMNSRKKGMAAETIACRFLEMQGYEILEQNFMIRTGEIDIIAKEKDTIVFIEVKYRKDTGCGYPSEAVDGKKQHKIRQTAMVYLKQRGFSFDIPLRFDVVEILGKKIRVIKHAF